MSAPAAHPPTAACRASCVRPSFSEQPCLNSPHPRDHGRRRPAPRLQAPGPRSRRHSSPRRRPLGSPLGHRNSRGAHRFPHKGRISAQSATVGASVAARTVGVASRHHGGFGSESGVRAARWPRQQHPRKRTFCCAAANGRDGSDPQYQASALRK